MPQVSSWLAIFFVLSIQVDCATQVASKSPIGPSPRAGTQTMMDRYGDPMPAGCIARLGTVRLRLKQSLRATAFSPDGRFLAVGEVRRESGLVGSPSLIRLLDTVTGTE